MTNENKLPVIIISAVCGDIGCSAVRALREATDKIIGCDMKPYSPVEEQLDSFFEVPGAADKENYMKAIKEIMTREEASYFLPISEPEIQLTDEKRDELESWGLKLLLNNRTIIGNFLDKLKTVQYLSAIGLKAPKTALLSEYVGNFTFPLIVKPRSGYGSKRLWKAEDDDDLNYLRRKDNGLLIVQEYLGKDSQEYTTGVFSDGQNISSISFRRRLGFGGLSAEAVLTDIPSIHEVAEKVAQSVNLKGCINIQGRLVGDTFIPFEINPRLSSTLLIRKRFGFDDAVWWLNLLSGKPYHYRKAYRTGKVVRCVSECYFEMVRSGDDDQ